MWDVLSLIQWPPSPITKELIMLNVKKIIVGLAGMLLIVVAAFFLCLLTISLTLLIRTFAVWFLKVWVRNKSYICICILIRIRHKNMTTHLMVCWIPIFWDLEAKLASQIHFCASKVILYLSGLWQDVLLCWNGGNKICVKGLTWSSAIIR